jgi:NAD+ dependent glucose-6-phosphate dehydrogenase
VSETPTTVLITGATGNIGRKLRAHLAAAERYELRLLCLNPQRDPAVQTADLAVWDEAWAKAFEGVDTVLHAAADPSPFAGWASIQRLNLDLLLNVMAAAQQRGVRRVVFASSNYVMAGYRFGNERLTTDLEPFPINPYGTSKLFGERVGKMFAERYGLSFIAFRIGVCQRANDNRHGPWIPFGHWGQAMWVSDRDLCRAFEAAILDRNVRFGVYNLMSRNPGMRWDLANLKAELGFEPVDGEPMRVPVVQRLKAGCAWLRDAGLPALARHVSGRRW